MAKLSVVVPIYNVEDYLQEALESVARQTLRDLEVIMVDDGSTDGSALIAKSFAARDPRFRLLQQDNQGQGPARNLGARQAAGDYLAFFDADDVLPGHAYDLLVGSLEATGSDIAAGGVRRFSTGWISKTAVHTAYRTTVLRTNVSQHQALLRDCTVWNKVFRRSFWETAALEFPAARYEDIPICIRAYVLARSVDIRHEIVYYWRARESGELSRGQKSRELENIEGRMAAVLESASFLADRAPALKPAFDGRVLDNDLSILVSAVEFAGEPERKRMLDLAASYLSSVDDSVFRAAKALQRLRYHLIREGRYAELLEVLRYARRGDAAKAPLVRMGRLRRRWYIDYPYLADQSCAVPRQVYDADREMGLHVRVDAVTWHAGRLRIEGHAYIRRLHAPRQQDTRIKVMLRNTVLKRAIRLEVTRVERPDVTARSGQSAACYDWSGFMVEVKPGQLSNLGTWRAASWELRVKVRGRGVRREGPVASSAPASPALPEDQWVAAGVRLQAASEVDGRYLIRAERPGALVTACRADGDDLHIEGWSVLPLGKKAKIVISLQQGGGTSARIGTSARVPAAATGAAAGRYGFSAVVPIARLLSVSGTADREAGSQEGPDGADEPVMQVGDEVGDEVRLDLALDPGTGPAVRLAGEPGAAGSRLIAGGLEITTYLTPYGNFSAIRRTCRLVVRELDWTESGGLVLRGDHPAAETAPTAILLRSTGSGYQHTVPLQWHDREFSACLSPGSMPGQAGDLPLASGRWELLAATPAGETRTVADRALLARLPAPRRTGIHEVAVGRYRGDALQLTVRIAGADRGAYAQRQLQDMYAAQADGGRFDDLVVFDSYGGKQYSCNPRAVYEELRQRDTGLQCVWLTHDGQVSVPDGGRTVVRGSSEHYQLAARARFIVSNSLQPTWYRRPAGQVYLQTWHGTPLKRICLDVESPQFTNGIAYHDRVRSDVAKWDALISENSFSTPIFRRAFGFDGDILEFGYPRNDVLHSPDAAARAARIRHQLGLPPGTRTVLYAPTWRDDAKTRAGGFGFPQHLDLNGISRALGPDHVTLVRGHHMIKESLVTGFNDGAIIDVTRYPDISDLFLITDVLITDYSSAMFDFAVTGRPMLFFTYDLERYRDKLRGFYFDFEAEAPGPLLSSSDDVIDALRNLDDISRGYDAAYAAFSARFCSLEDGHAAARTVDWLLSQSR